MTRIPALWLLIIGCAPAATPAPQDAVTAAKTALEELLAIRARVDNARPELERQARELMRSCYEELPAEPKFPEVNPDAVEIVESMDAGGGAVRVRAKAGAARFEARAMPAGGGGWKLDQVRRECPVCAGKDPDCAECEGSGYAAFLQAYLPRRPAAGAEVDPSKFDGSDAVKAVESLIKLRAEAIRRAAPIIEPLHQAALAWADKHLTVEAAKALRESLTSGDAPPEIKIVHKEPDRRRTIVHLAVPRIRRGAAEEEEIFEAVRVRLRKTGEAWKIQEEALYCPGCKSHRACESCESTGIMRGHGHMSPCSGCRADGDCARCSGAGFVGGYTILRIPPDNQ